MSIKAICGYTRDDGNKELYRVHWANGTKTWEPWENIDGKEIEMIEPDCGLCRLSDKEQPEEKLGLIRRASRLLQPPCSRPRFAAATFFI